MVVAIAVLVLALPVGLLVAAVLMTDDEGADAEPPATAPDAEDDDASGPDDERTERDDPGPPPADEELEPPDPSAFDGVDAVFARLLVDIDASERAMIAFQDGLQEAFEELGLEDASELVARVETLAGDGVARLADVRERLEDPLDDAGAEAVRVEYVDHLDAWMRYMEAVEDQPTLLDPDVDSSRYLLAINTSAEAFARTLEDALPDDIDDEVAAFADGILDRGFRVDTEPQA